MTDVLEEDVPAPSLEERVEDIRKTIEMYPLRAASEVVTLAREHAFDHELRIEAVMLQSVDLDTAEGDALSGYRDKLNALVDKVLADSKNPTEHTLEAYKKRQAVFDKTRGRSIESRTVIRTKKLTRVLKGDRDFTLKDVSLDLQLGKVTGVVGGNGAGKSTLFRLLVGEMAATSGNICFPELGEDNPRRVNWSKVKRKIAYVPQHLPRWYGSLEDNLRYTAASKGLTGAANDQAFTFITNRLGLRNHLGLTWNKLSGGFQLRFALAQALIWSPRFLVLDEPLAHLDFRAQRTLLNDVSGLARSYTDPIAVLISSQHLFEIEAVADDILFINKGNVEFYDAAENIGKDRAFNVFEVGSKCGLYELQRALSDKKIRRVDSDGMNFQVQTERDLSGNELLFQLTSKEIPVTYFRDISSSVRYLFDAKKSIMQARQSEG